MSNSRDGLKGEEGSVYKVEDGFVEVRFPRKTMCEHCGACGILSESALEMSMRVADNGSLTVGDRVMLSIDRAYFMISAWLLYGVPLAALIAGIIMGTLNWGDGIPAAALAIGMAGICYLLLRILDNKLRQWRRQHIRLEKITEEEFIVETGNKSEGE